MDSSCTNKGTVKDTTYIIDTVKFIESTEKMTKGGGLISDLSRWQWTINKDAKAAEEDDKDEVGDKDAEVGKDGKDGKDDGTKVEDFYSVINKVINKVNLEKTEFNEIQEIIKEILQLKLEETTANISESRKYLLENINGLEIYKNISYEDFTGNSRQENLQSLLILTIKIEQYFEIKQELDRNSDLKSRFSNILQKLTVLKTQNELAKKESAPPAALQPTADPDPEQAAATNPTVPEPEPEPPASTSPDPAELPTTPTAPAEAPANPPSPPAKPAIPTPVKLTQEQYYELINTIYNNKEEEDNTIYFNHSKLKKNKFITFKNLVGIIFFSENAVQNLFLKNSNQSVKDLEQTVFTSLYPQLVNALTHKCNWNNEIFSDKITLKFK